MDSMPNSTSARRSPKAAKRQFARLHSRPKERGKSRVANGSALIPGVDGRSVWIRRAKEIIADALSDLGGEANTSAAERSLVRRAATISVELERLEAKFATAGEADPADLDLYQKLANTLRRLLGAIGLQRRSRDVTVPSLQQYMQRGAAE
jgi:hypothetical protein